MAADKHDKPPPEAMVMVEGKTKPSQPHWFERYIQPCAAELLGTAYFVFVGCLSVVEDTPSLGRLQPALVHGLVLGLLIATMAGVSGGHLNPAVSLGFWLVGALNITMVIPYWVCQLCGAMVGAGLAKAVTVSERFTNTSGGAFKGVVSDDQIGAALGTEIILTTFLLLLAMLGAVNGKTKTPQAAFCIGLNVVVNVLAGGSVSGACMNPARAFGPAVVANYWDYHWVYWVGPMVGGLLSGVLMRFLLGDRNLRLFLK